MAARPSDFWPYNMSNLRHAAAVESLALKQLIHCQIERKIAHENCFKTFTLQPKSVARPPCRKSPKSSSRVGHSSSWFNKYEFVLCFEHRKGSHASSNPPPFGSGGAKGIFSGRRAAVSLLQAPASLVQVG